MSVQSELKRGIRKLLSRFWGQKIPADRWQAMTSCMGYAFRPGGHSDSFAGRSILPAGTAVMFQLGYEVHEAAGGGERFEIPCVGLRGLDQPNGGVRYEPSQTCLRVNLGLRPRAGGRGRIIDPERNPSLLETALRIDKECQRAVAAGRRLPDVGTLPRVLLSFTESRLPPFRDTPALRHRAARQAGISVRKLMANGEVLMERLLRDTWEQSIICPTDPRNWTETYLVDAALCPTPQGFLRIYEDFGEILGVPVWNPVRGLKVERFANPASEVLVDVGLGNNPDFNQPIAGELIERMIAGMRCRLQDLSSVFTDEDLLDGITNPDLPLITWSQLRPKLRGRLSPFALECSTDDDLKTAAFHPEEPLLLRNACRVQVIQSSGVHSRIARSTVERTAIETPQCVSKDIAQQAELAC